MQNNYLGKALVDLSLTWNHFVVNLDVSNLGPIRLIYFGTPWFQFTALVNIYRKESESGKPSSGKLSRFLHQIIDNSWSEVRC